MFSGLRSQCIILAFSRNNKAYNIYIENLLIKSNEIPWNKLFFMNSYKLIESNSNTMHTWFLNTIKSNILTILV